MRTVAYTAGLLVSMATMLGGASNAHAVTPTQDQIDQFMALPEAQRNALAAQYGISLPSNRSSASSSQRVTDVPVVKPLQGQAQQGYPQGYPYGYPQNYPQSGNPVYGSYPSGYGAYGAGYPAQGAYFSAQPYPYGAAPPNTGASPYHQGYYGGAAPAPYSNYYGASPYGSYSQGMTAPPGMAGVYGQPTLINQPTNDQSMSSQQMAAPSSVSGTYPPGQQASGLLQSPAGAQQMPGLNPALGRAQATPGGYSQFSNPPTVAGPGLSQGAPWTYELPLRPFGYDLFAAQPTTFAPVTEIPVPSEYKLGPGDVVKIQLFGKENKEFELQINREGVLQLPELGPMSVAGMSFDDLKSYIARQVSERFIGVESSVSLGELRSIRIFVLGDSRTPGSYSVSALSTMTNALYVSGGVLESGSLRRVQLKRGGKIIAELDLYDLLLSGDTRNDLRLQAGDAVFIPPVGETVAIQGKVRRPAIYELKGERNVDEVIQLAGGLLPDANLQVTKVTRVKSGQNTEVVDIDLSLDKGRLFAVRNGDTVTIQGVNELSEGYVGLYGEIVRPGFYTWKPGLRISDVIPSLRLDVKASADLGYALLVREINSQRNITTYAINLAEAISNPASPDNLELKELDRVLVFPRGFPKEPMLQPVLMKLAQQARPGEAQKIIEIAGEVPFPGYYPLPENQSTQNVLLAAGGLGDAAYTLNTEVARYRAGEDGGVKTEIMNLNLDRLLKGEESFQFLGRDHILVKRLPDYAMRMQVKVEGEVRFPGTYTLTRGQTLSDLLERAGGLTGVAFPEGAVFTRIKLAEIEAERLVEAEKRLQKDLSALQLEAANAQKAAPQDTETLESLLADVRSSKPLGRLVVDLNAVQQGDPNQNVVLQDGDILKVPQMTQSVSVIGEVQFATSHLFSESLSVKDYIARSGGETNLADASRTYVVRANGSVWLPDSSGWFGGSDDRLHRGDTIVVPMETDRLNKLQLWTNISQIMYQIALGAAAVGSL
jgi:polysaccharide export outer membrane protein